MYSGPDLNTVKAGQEKKQLSAESTWSYWTAIP